MIKLTRTNYAGSSTATMPEIKLEAQTTDEAEHPFVTIRAAIQPGYPEPQPIIMQTPYMGVLVIEYIEDTHDSAA